MSDSCEIPEEQPATVKTILILTVAATILALLVLGKIFIFLFPTIVPHPDFTESHDQYLVTFTPEHVENEHVEKNLYFFVLICLPFLLISFWKLFDNLLRTKFKVSYSFVSFISAILVLMLAVASFSADSTYGADKYYFIYNSFYFNHLIIYIPLFSAMCLFFLSEKRPQIPRPLISVFYVLSIIFAVWVVLCVVFWYWKGVRPIFQYHFEPVLYAATQVLGGKGLLVDLTNLYGLYPVFLEPLLRVFGFSIQSFTGIMAVLLGIAYAGMYCFLKNVIKSKFILLIGFCSIPALCLINPLAKASQFDAYYQYAPIRLLFPCAFICLASYYFKQPVKGLYFAMTILCSIGFLWNIDTGLFIIITLFLTLSYTELIAYKKEAGFADNIKRIARKIFLHFISVFGTLFIVISLYCIYTKIRYGSFPSFSMFIEFPKLFSVLGFGALPMPMINVWNLHALAYIIGLGISVGCIFTKRNKYISIIIFMTSILGCGLFSYYQGRSHDANIIPVTYMAVLLSAVFIDLLYQSIIGQREKKAVGELVLFCSLLFFLGSSLFTFADKQGAGAFYNESYSNLKSLVSNEPSVYDADTAFISKYTEPGEEVLILCETQGALYGYTHTSNPVKMTGLGELFKKEYYNNYLGFLQTTDSAKVFIFPSYLYEEIGAAITSRFTYIDHTESNSLIYYRIASDNDH